MEKILTQGENVVKDMKELILQPQSEISHFRRFLAENGYAVIKEDMVEEDGKFYPMMKAVQGEMQYTKKAEYLYGTRASGNPAPGVKRIPGKRGPGGQKSFWKTFPCRYAFCKEAEQRADRRDQRQRGGPCLL